MWHRYFGWLTFDTISWEVFNLASVSGKYYRFAFLRWTLLFDEWEILSSIHARRLLASPTSRYLACLVPIDSHMPRLDSVSIGCEFNKAASLPRPVSQGRRPPVSTSLSFAGRPIASTCHLYNTAVPPAVTILARFPGGAPASRKVLFPFALAYCMSLAASLAMAHNASVFALCNLQNAKARKIAAPRGFSFRKTRYLNPNISIRTESFH